MSFFSSTPRVARIYLRVLSRFCCLVLLACCAALADDIDPDRYWHSDYLTPMAIGNQWTFRYLPPEGEPEIMIETVTGTATSEFGLAYKVEGTVKDSSGQIVDEYVSWFIRGVWGELVYSGEYLDYFSSDDVNFEIKTPVWDGMTFLDNQGQTVRVELNEAFTVGSSNYAVAQYSFYESDESTKPLKRVYQSKTVGWVKVEYFYYEEDEVITDSFELMNFKEAKP